MYPLVGNFVSSFIRYVVVPARLLLALLLPRLHVHDRPRHLSLLAAGQVHPRADLATNQRIWRLGLWCGFRLLCRRFLGLRFGWLDWLTYEKIEQLLWTYRLLFAICILNDPFLVTQIGFDWFYVRYYGAVESSVLKLTSH